MFYGHTKLFNGNSKLAAPCAFYQTAAHIRYRHTHFALNIDLITVLDLIPATDENAGFT